MPTGTDVLGDLKSVHEDVLTRVWWKQQIWIAEFHLGNLSCTTEKYSLKKFWLGIDCTWWFVDCSPSRHL